jgi:hypothetical protein
MNQPASFDNTLYPRFQPDQNSVLNWAAILVFVFVSALLMVLGAGKILNIAFPAGSFLIGILLYFRAPVLYVGFCWWVCFLCPFVRRVADWRSGYTDPSPILLSPFLVAFVALIGLCQCIPKCHRQGSLPFVLATIGITYASLIGLINQPMVAVVKSYLEWSSPVIFGHHLFINWRNYPLYRRSLQKTFLWGILVMGSYGIFQYMTLPEWDSFWITNSGFDALAPGIEIPEPQGVRVFSTLNSQEPFTAVVTAGMLLLFGSRSILQFPAYISGGLCLLLSSVRSSWIGLALGFLLLMASANLKLQIRLILLGIAAGMCLFTLANVEPFKIASQHWLMLKMMAVPTFGEPHSQNSSGRH